jgi:hypothetical protein
MSKNQKPYLNKFRNEKQEIDIIGTNFYNLMNNKNETILIDKSKYIVIIS